MPSEPELLADVAATHALAARLAAELGPGDALGLVGDLGAGKTEFTRGLLSALGAPAGLRVASPSYLLLNLYAGGRLPVAHFDAYFMDGPDDLLRAGLPELLASGHLAVVEWADRVEQVMPAHTRWLTLEAGAGQSERRARLGLSRPGEASP
ncbi:MAG: tRNA (adenosine(37)-N6)-threonylcarbamoyltransferase complex ATPase subunit type 1 TsaE [Planctomycetota bacterium]|nr:MAG: tRNA (adenosine(37)-N6)-threonylcarbamoyltransferase complex ATPase subunit type 1 TsaE [Planctomycetota bacterium]